MRRTYISSIPDEMILEIFSYLVEPDAIDVDDDDLSDDDNDIWDWIVVTHICRRWRTLAVNDLRLWTAPDLATHSRRRLEAFIIRSRAFLLTVDNRKGCRSCMRRDMNPWGCEIWDENLSIVLNHLSRIRSLLLDYCTLDRAMQLCDKAAPMLETLDIAFHGNDFELPFSLPVPFLAGGVPRLRKIRLHEGILSFNSTLLRDLTHLTINDFYDDDDHYTRYSRLYPSVEEILLTLKACPSLEVLILGAVKDSGPDEILRIGEHFHVSLTCLRTLLLEDMNFQAAEKLFSLMDVPNVSNFTFGIRFAYQDSRSSLLSILKRFTKRFAYDTMELRFELFKTVVDCSIENEDENIEGKLDLYHIDDDGELIIPSASVLASILTEFIEKTTWRGVNSLTLMLNDKPVFNRLQWDNLLVLMPNIKELSIYRFSSSMSKAMTKTFKNILFLLLPNYHDVENLWDVLWLRLNSLKINFVPNPQVFEDVLAEVLERRYLLNRRIRFLEFSSCGSENTELISSVSPYVDTTEWVCNNGTRTRYTTW